MSALPPKADITQTNWHVRFVPKATYAVQQYPTLFDHLVGAREQRRRHGEAKRFGSRDIDDQLEFRRLLDWEICGIRTTQYLVDIICCAPEPFRVAWSVGHERTGFDKITSTENRRHPRIKRRRENA